jgi:hypothetical protein
MPTNDNDLASLRSLIPISAHTDHCHWLLGQRTFLGSHRELQHDLNEMADSLATEFQRSQKPPFHRQRAPIPPPDYDVRLLHHNSIKTSHCYRTLAHIMHDSALQCYILRKTKWTGANFHQVDWASHKRAINHLSRHQIQTVRTISIMEH